MANRWLDDDDLNKTSDRWGGDDCEDFDPNKDYYAQKLQKKENNMLQSTERSLRLLEQSERVGNAAAVELDRQGEVLRRTEKRVDKMEKDLKQSDRHLRSIKSVWGAFMNKFSKEPPPEKTVAEIGDTTESRFQKNPESSKPAPQFESSESALSGSLRRGPTNEVEGYEKAGGSSSMSASSTMSAVDDNLDLIGNSLTRLKSLGLGLKDELDAQDPVLSRLAGKVERVDDKMHNTNKEMLKIYHS